MLPALGQAAESRVAQQFAQPVSITWQDVPLATALSRLEETQSLAIWLDRRIDPNVPITLTAVDRPLAEALAMLGEQAGAAAAPFAGVIYFGPPQTADELATLAALARQPLAKAPAAVRARWLKPQSWTFPRLSQPRELLKELVASVNAKVQNEQSVPHDLWPASELPAMAPVDRAVLLLASFDLTCRISRDGGALQVIPIARPVVVTQEYRVPNARKPAFDAALAEVPNAQRAGDGSRQTVAVRVEDHKRLRAALSGRSADAVAAAIALRTAGAKSASSPLEDRRFTLTIENKPLAPVLNQLASQLGLQLQWDASIPEGDGVRSTLVSCQVDKADLDQLLKALLEPAGLTAERRENRISIRRQ
jgi:hypothetical protein